MTDWIEHNGGPQPVADDVWVERDNGNHETECAPAGAFEWRGEEFKFHVINQHLIDAKQAEIDALRDDLETWQSVFPHVMPDRLKSDQQLADEGVAAKIDAARLKGIRLGLKAAAKVAAEKVEKRVKVPCPDGVEGCLAFHFRREYRDKSAPHIAHEIRALNPETIAKEAQHD